jgi:hypothetical protein
MFRARIAHVMDFVECDAQEPLSENRAIFRSFELFVGKIPGPCSFNAFGLIDQLVFAL